jgi:subtilisin family serine protease
MVSNNSLFKYTQIITFIIVLSSCSGGGGGSMQNPVSNTNSPPTTGPTYEELKAQYESNYEYQQQYGLGLIKASSAYAKGATGKNVIIGITDSGLDDNHVEIDKSRLDPRSALSYSNYTPSTSQKRHGTAVASIAAGTLSENSDTFMHGVAFDANIFFVAIELAEPDDTYEPVDLGDGPGGDPDPNYEPVDNFFEYIFELHTSRQIDVVNNSYGYSGSILDYSEQVIRNAFSKSIAAIAQSNTLPQDKTIFVWAAGNAGGYADDTLLDENGNVQCNQDYAGGSGVNFCSPEIFPGMTYYIPEIQGHSIAVVSVDENGVISDFSNRCGIASAFCIAAPGEGITIAYSTSSDDLGIFEPDAGEDNYACVSDNSCFAVGGGTSFAAPFVSGAIAVLIEYFEGQLGSTEIVERLFLTANDQGIYSNSQIYGQGLIDLEAATNPVGTMTVATARSIFGEMAPLFSTGLNAFNPALGNSIINGLQSKSLIAFDELGSPFRIPVASLIASPGINSQRLDSLGAFGNPKTETYNEDGLIYEYIQRAPINDINHFSNSYLSSFSELNQTINIIDPNTGSFISYGKNDNKHYSTKNYFNSSNIFENPYLDFTKHGILISQNLKLNTFDLTWVASIGQPEVTLEEIFLDRSMNSQLSFILSGSLLPDIQLGWLNEKDSVVGLSSSGAFNFSKNTDSYFLGIHKSFDFDKSSLSFTGYRSYVDDNTFKNSLINGMDDIETSFYKASFYVQDIFSNTDLELEHVRPLFISRGKLNIDLPVYRDRYLNLYTEDLSLQLAADQHEIVTSIKLKWNAPRGLINLRLDSVENSSYRGMVKDYLNLSLGFKYLF